VPTVAVAVVAVVVLEAVVALVATETAVAGPASGKNGRSEFLEHH
jgi:hypothetical protein